MQDLQAKLEKLLLEAEDCALISKLADNPTKRAAFAKLALQLRKLACDTQTEISGAKELILTSAQDYDKLAAPAQECLRDRQKLGLRRWPTGH
jgi:hypothetical protein